MRHLERVPLAAEERAGPESTYVAVERAPRLDADFDPDSSLYGHLAGQGISFDANAAALTSRCRGPEAGRPEAEPVGRRTTGVKIRPR